MKKTIIAGVLLLISAFSFAQFTINGKVIDTDTKEPLSAASVFAQNTTRGTTTDTNGIFHLALDKGGYELVVSFTGYVPRSISVGKENDQQLIIELSKADNSMSEVIVKSSNEVPDGWEKYGSFFIKYFIGSTPFADSCTLLNPQALKFLYYKKSDRLKVLATEPLQVSNRALGYSLRYELDSFVYHFKSDLNSYRGLCLYSKMEGSADEQRLWRKNRKEAYLGSRLHFLRSYYDSTLRQEGFIVDMRSKTNANKFNRLANPYDTAYYYYTDSTDDVELYFPTKISIGYTKAPPLKEYIQQNNLSPDTRVQYSYVDLLDGIVIKPNGYFFDQKSWISQGYWSWKNLADQLPYDYEPGD